MEERGKVVVGLVDTDLSLLRKFSTLSTLVRVTAYCFRFIDSLKKSVSARKLNISRVQTRQATKRRDSSFPLSAKELDSALTFWIVSVQGLEFANEIEALKKKEPSPKKSKLLSLCPFLDPVGVLRVGGRLKHSSFATDKKYPILLPKKHFLTELIVGYFHLNLMHAGPQLLLATIQQKYWILCGRDVVRFFVRKCIICFRQRAEVSQQMMGDLPAARVNPGRPFLKCGVDYAGPFSLTAVKGRGQKIFKAYICLFVCFVTRAIHLEMVIDLTTETFLAALNRFISRRGLCSDIFSDCGTNFVGAHNELKELTTLTKNETHKNQVSKFAAEKGMTWHFNPHGAPHFGGLWEAGVKSVKFHLKRITGNLSLCVEEMLTILAQIEACLNSRPLTAMSTDPSDLSVLTPGHFLIGDALNAVPQQDFTSLKENRLSRWERTQQISQHFWRRWSSEYMARLQQRPKWWSKKENIKIGDLILLKDENLPPLKWNMGRIIKLHPGTDNIVRAVTLKTPTGEIQRPIVKLCVLPLDKDIT